MSWRLYLMKADRDKDKQEATVSSEQSTWLRQKGAVSVKDLFERVEWWKRDSEMAIAVADELDRLTAENARVKQAAASAEHEVQQILGKALGYAPLHPEASQVDDGQVCVGEHTAASIALEAALTLAKLAIERDRNIAKLAELQAEREDLIARNRIGGEFQELFQQRTAENVELRHQVAELQKELEVSRSDSATWKKTSYGDTVAIAILNDKIAELQEVITALESLPSGKGPLERARYLASVKMHPIASEATQGNREIKCDHSLDGFLGEDTDAEIEKLTDRIESLEADNAELQAVVNRLPKIWRRDESGTLVQDVPLTPDIRRVYTVDLTGCVQGIDVSGYRMMDDSSMPSEVYTPAFKLYDTEEAAQAAADQDSHS